MTKGSKTWRERFDEMANMDEKPDPKHTLYMTQDNGTMDTYPEHIYELDPEKVKAFISQELELAKRERTEEILAEFTKRIEDENFIKWSQHWRCGIVEGREIVSKFLPKRYDS